MKPITTQSLEPEPGTQRGIRHAAGAKRSMSTAFGITVTFSAAMPRADDVGAQAFADRDHMVGMAQRMRLEPRASAR